jgi:hypothetical protein
MDMETFAIIIGYSSFAIGGVTMVSVLLIISAFVVEIGLVKWKTRKRIKEPVLTPEEWFLKISDYERQDPVAGRERAIIKVIGEVIEKTKVRFGN